MNKDELKAKYNRISNDPRQAQEFVNELIDEVAALEKNQLPDATEAAEGNILSLDSEKKPEWSAPAAGGTKLYRHRAHIFHGSGYIDIDFYTTTNTPQDILTLWGNNIACKNAYADIIEIKQAGGGSTPPISIIKTNGDYNLVDGNLSVQYQELSSISQSNIEITITEL